MGNLWIYFFVEKWCMGSFCLKNRDFGPKDKRLRISRDVINWLGIHPPIQDLSQKTICCLFLKAQRETKNGFWVFKQGSRKPNFPLVCFSIDETFRLYHGQKATSVLSVFYTLCCIRSNRSRSHGVSMSPRCDTVVSDENEKCWKTDNF